MHSLIVVRTKIVAQGHGTNEGIVKECTRSTLLYERSEKKNKRNSVTKNQK